MADFGNQWFVASSTSANTDLLDLCELISVEFESKYDSIQEN